MKTLSIKMFLVLFFFGTFSQAQNWLKTYEGIPIITGLHWDFTNNSDAMNKMRAVVDGVQIDLGLKDNIPYGDPDDMMDLLVNTYGFQIIPNAVYKNNTRYNYISYYTDARYTVWETEGEYGDTSYLRHNPNVMALDSSYFIKLKPDAVCGEKELMWGPYYTQYVYETNNDRSIDTAYYTPIFRMKIEVNPNPPSCEDTTVWTDNPETPICIIQVTQSKLKYPNDWTFECTHPIREEIITLNRFQSLGQFKDITFETPSYYDLLSDACQPVALEEPPPQVNTENMELYVNGNDLLKQRGYIEFKVIWLGNPNFLLSIDNVTVYDQKGQEIMDPNSQASTNIHNQIDQLQDYETSILGWFGRDEPNSIDQYDPIKRVIEIINDDTNNQSPLWLALMGKWDGAFSNREDPNGTYHLSPWKEMKKRIGNMNVWQDIYMFDYPYQENGLYDPPPGETWQEANIRVTSKLNYKPAYELDPNFGVSLQCGQVYLAGIADERNIFGYELMYETNLALMNGAKFLSLYTYFAQRKTNDCNSGWTCHAIVDILPDGSLYYTGKYDTLLTIISPRLKGLMGNTLKKLSPIDQILKVPLNTQFSFSNFINKIIKGDCTTQGSQSGDYVYDLGFLTDSLSRDYFMILSRWYNGQCNPALTIKLKPEYYNNFNIKVVDYINDQTYNTNRFGSINTAPGRGDAGFFGVFPILQYGGSISLNDTTYDGETLLDDLTVENGATLYIVEDYYANANITVKNGGKIIYGDAGKIIFAPGKKIIIDGIAEIKGSSFINKLTLEFAGSEIGIDVLPGSSLTLSYCNITGAYYGIVTRTGTPSYLNITYSNFAFGSTGIVLNGNFYIGGPTPTSTISNCNFTTWGTGLSVSNNSSVIISQNNFTSCGISILDVPAAYIQSNSIYSGSNESYSGIFFNMSEEHYVSSNKKNGL